MSEENETVVCQTVSFLRHRGVFLPGTTMKVIKAEPRDQDGIYKFILEEL